MAKKHEHTRTANGSTYKSYRKQASYRGRTFRPEAKNSTDWEAKFEDFKRLVDSDFRGSNPDMRVHELADLFNDEARANKKPKTIEVREMVLKAVRGSPHRAPEATRA